MTEGGGEIPLRALETRDTTAVHAAIEWCPRRLSLSGLASVRALDVWYQA